MHLRKKKEGLQRNKEVEDWWLMMTDMNILSSVLFVEEWESEESCSPSYNKNSASSGCFRTADNIEITSLLQVQYM